MGKGNLFKIICNTTYPADTCWYACKRHGRVFSQEYKEYDDAADFRYLTVRGKSSGPFDCCQHFTKYLKKM